MILVLAMVLSMIPMVVSAETSDSTQFVLMSTADVHGKVWNKNLLNDTNVNNSLLNVATAVKEIRGEYGENTLLVDNGDLYQGTPVASYHISQYSQGQVYDINPVTLALEYIGYDTYTLGNHEFNYPWETMVDFYDYLETKGIPCSCANLYFEATGERVFAPYYTKTLTLAGQEFVIGVIGIENTDCTRWDVPDNYPGIIFASPENEDLDVAYEVNKVLAEMEADGVECDFVVLNYHSGLGSDVEDLEYGKNTENQILRTIKRTSGLDVVVAGHDHSSTYSHNTYTDKGGNEVLVVNSGSTSLTKSVFNVSWDETNGFTVTTEKSENLNLANYAVDQGLYDIIKPYAEAANTYVNTSVGTLAGEWDGSNKNLYTVQSDTVDLINRAQVWAGNTYLTDKYGTVEGINAKLREMYGEDTAKQLEGDKIEVDLSSTSVVTTGPARAGELSMKGIYTFYKYDNSLYLLVMTGQEIKDLLEYNAAERLNAKVSNGSVNYQTIGDDFSNPVFYGLNFVYDMAQAKGERVIIDGFSNGKAFELDKTYVVAMNNYHLGNASNDELSKYATTDALWSQTDDLGGGYVQDIIANYVGTLTERDGGVYATKNAAQNGEVASAWSLTYSGDTSSVILPDETTYIGTEVAVPVDGDQVIFYYPAGVTTMAGSKAAGAKFAALDANVNGDKLFALEGSGVFTVGVSDQGVTFKTEEGYLSCTGSGDLSYQAEANANSYWEVIPTEGGVFIESKVHENVYMEHYYGFTTYFSYNPNDAYIFKLYSVEDVASIVDGEALAAGDNVVIYYNNNGSLIASAANGAKLGEVASEAATTESGSILAAVDGAAIFKVEVNADGKLLFHAAEGYLTSGASGNSLSLTAEATEYSLWDLQKTEGGYFIHSVNANYNGNYNQYIEYYYGFTTYGLSGSSNAALYTFNFYKVDVVENEEDEEEEPVVEGTSYRLPVYETSDVHGSLLDSSSGNPDTYQYRMAYIADIVNDARNGDASTTLLLDGGDIYQGNVISNLQDGQPLTAAYDMMGYDAVALGNHEFDWGYSVVVDADATMSSYNFGDYVGDSQIPVLASNIYKDGERVTFTKDYVILEKTATDAEGNQITVTIGLVGFADNYAADIMYANFTGAGLYIDEDYAALEALAAKLEDEGCDATIVLTHADATAIAARLGKDTVIDLIAGGHSHKSNSGANYIQPANGAAGLAYAELVFVADEDGEVVDVAIENTNVISVTADKTKLYDTPDNDELLDDEIVALSKVAVANVADTLNEVLGYITVPVTKDAIDGNRMSSTAGNWMASLYNRAVDAEVSFINNGGIRTTFVMDGAAYRYVTAGDVYTIAPFCNLIYAYDVTYAELLEVLEYSIGAGSGMGLRMTGIDCYYEGKTVNTLVKDGVVIYNAGEWTEGWADKSVVISTNEYVATSDTPFAKWNETDKLISKTTVDNEAAIEALKAEKEVNNGYLYVDPNAHLIAGAYEAPAAHEHEYITITFEVTDTHYGYTAHICNECGDYYETDIVPVGDPIDAPVITASNNAKTGKVKLAWKAVEGAAQYKVYRATTKEGTYKLMYTTTGTTYTNTKANPGQYYYYYVVAVTAKGNESEPSNIAGRTCDLAQPVVTASNNPKTGKVRLTWDAVENAVEYKVYRATSKNGTYKLMFTTTGTSYTNTKATAGVTYYYKVVACARKTAGNSAASAVVSRTCDLPQTKLTGKVNLLGRPKLTWNKVEGAVKYKVYRAETETGTYKLMYTTTGTSYTNTKDISGRSYYYYVVAVCENTWGNSAPSNIVKLIVNKNAPEDIVILYTNDVHTYIDKPLSYDVIAGVKKELEKKYDNVLLMDAGDHSQGTAYGSMDKGATIIELMNTADYDLATLGNHEFDYGMDGTMNIIDWADYPYVSCNFYNEKNGVVGKSVLPAYKLYDYGNEMLAVIGITTPESFTKSTPAYFQDGNGNYIYGIAGGADGKALYNAVQTAINDAKAAGATKVIALGHLGDDPSSAPWTSAETISNVYGLDAFIDGHSHSTVEGKLVDDKNGKDVVLTQTGEYFDRIGMMHIDGETGVITTDFIEYTETADGYALVSDLYTGASWVSDEATAAVKEAWIAEIDNQLNTVIGTANVALGNYENGKRLVRSQETNAGDFCADALYYLFDNMGLDVDVAIMNGGGIRNKADVTGELTYKVAKEIHTFGNVACLQTVSGQQLLDALEWGARVAGTGEECGGFLQVAGITYDIDAEWPTSVQMDDKGVWVGAPTGGYRVSNVKVYNKATQAYEPLDLTASYNMAGYNYTLRDLGDGFNMFDGAVNVLDYVMEDYMVLANYIKGFEGGEVDATNSPLKAKYSNMMLDYGTLAGSGRITIG